MCIRNCSDSICFLKEQFDRDDNRDLVFYVPFNIMKVISRRWKGYNERLCAKKHCTVMDRFPPSAGFESWTRDLKSGALPQINTLLNLVTVFMVFTVRH